MGALGFRIGVDLSGRRRRVPFTPALLFAGGEQGVWYDPADLATMTQDSAGTMPAALDAPVGRVLDKSGRGNHAVQANAAARPMLRRDEGGRWYLQFDGTDDLLRALFTITQPFERVSAIRHGNLDGNSRHSFGGGSAAGGILFHHAPVPSLSIASTVTAATRSDLPAGTTAIVTERFDGANSRLAVNLAAYTSANSGLVVPGGITIGGRHDGGATGASNLRLYGVVMRAGAMGDTRLGQLRQHLAEKAGIVL
jgi:hypothetical protein